MVLCRLLSACFYLLMLTATLENLTNITFTCLLEVTLENVDVFLGGNSFGIKLMDFKTVFESCIIHSV